MEDKLDEYFEGDSLRSELDPRKQKEKVKKIYRNNIWTCIASAAAGGAVSILLYKVVTAEKVVSSGGIRRER